eukprot:TRINITY_DN16915_c0_g1_i2.p1 TRINITY_DN16915_c0_g1~~TRINITY_DN16915_c0_g1_i2.p1  ORF type:complete len:101 (-),score=5.73 TRINITY_DN16915_c0_g1_i2:144-446(-)
MRLNVLCKRCVKFLMCENLTSDAATLLSTLISRQSPLPCMMSVTIPLTSSFRESSAPSVRFNDASNSDLTAFRLNVFKSRPPLEFLQALGPLGQNLLEPL